MNYEPITSLDDLQKGDTIRLHDDPRSYVVEQSVHEWNKQEGDKPFIIAVRVLTLTTHNGVLKLKE